MDRKKLRNDLFLVLSLLLVAAISIIVIVHKSVKNNLIAKISVQNQVVETIDLSKVGDKDYYIQGLNGELHVHTHDGAIAVVESNCPHQDCVKMGYVNDSNHPIICAYNAVYIAIEGDAINDVDVG